MKRLRELALNKEGFAFDPRTGESYYLNVSAHEVIEWLRSGDHEHLAAKKLADRYGLKVDVALEDIHDLLQQLQIHNLIDE